MFYEKLIIWTAKWIIKEINRDYAACLKNAVYFLVA
jgi:hypothetical protein